MSMTETISNTTTEQTVAATTTVKECDVQPSSSLGHDPATSGFTFKESKVDQVQQIALLALKEASTAEEQQKKQRQTSLTWVLHDKIPPGPTPIAYHSSEIVGERLFVFGGSSIKDKDSDEEYHTYDHYFDLVLKEWIPFVATGEPLSVRRSYSTCVIGRNILIFGGKQGNTYYNDITIFDTDTFEWRRPKATGQYPSPRSGHTCNAIGKMVYIIGGNTTGDVPLNDVHCLNTETMEWVPLQIKGKIPERVRHTATVISAAQDKIFVFGGKGKKNHILKDYHILDLKHMKWRTPPIKTNAPMGRFWHTQSTLNDTDVYIIGGFGTVNDFVEDINIFDTETESWKQIIPRGQKPKLTPKYGHSCSVHNNNIIYFGGITYSSKNPTQTSWHDNRTQQFNFNNFHIIDAGTFKRDIANLWDESVY
eukprot:GEZU01013958.1.p1 GENE.GEZU01013958.1~~GEZU01013958.1.p1  ORF type:complete len:422 (-),score=98.71 GEZU01013958.1:293-1558(-)